MSSEPESLREAPAHANIGRLATAADRWAEIDKADSDMLLLRLETDDGVDVCPAFQFANGEMAGVCARS
jgi:hypothetical protein